MIARYSRTEMTVIWDEDAKIASWAKVERAHLETLVSLGTCSAQVLADFDRSLGKKSSADFLRRERETGHDVIAFVAEVGEEMGPESGPFLHRGLTSSDVVDTALALRTRDAIDLLDKGLHAWRVALTQLAFTHAETLTIGRTHGIHAEPCSFGQIIAGYAAEAQRAHQSLLAARQAVSFGKLSGAVGAYSQLSPGFEKRVLALLSLQPETVATQVIPRDRITRVARAIEDVVAVVERFAVNLRHWARTELGEVLEPFGKQQKGSSAMPHKKNPVLAENLCGLARVARAAVTALSQDTALWHERDISHSSVERIALPDLFVTADFMLSRVGELTQNLDVAPQAMAKNLALTGGLWASGTVLTQLVAKGMSRTLAYEAVQAAALPLSQRLRAEHLEAHAFQQALTADARVSAKLTPAELAECFATERFLAHVSSVYERVFGVTAAALDWQADKGEFPVARVPALRRVCAAYVSLQPDVLDTEARTIATDMGHHVTGIAQVRQSKVFYVEMAPKESGTDRLPSVTQVEQYAREVLCNEVMETLRFEVIQ
jgi:adenylosuccinate lyase